MLAPERVSLNPPAEDPTLQSLDFCGLDPSWGIYLMAHDYPPPVPQTIHSGSSDTEGDVVVQSSYGNRTITAKVRVFEPSDPASQNLINNPTAELSLTLIGNEGGTAPARVIDPTGTPFGLNLDTYWTGAGAAAGQYGYWSGLGLVTGIKYTFSAYVKVTAKTGAAKLRLVLRKNAGAALANSATIEAVSTEWTRLTFTFVATESTGQYRLCVEQQEAGTIAWAATAAQVEEGPIATHYFDGDTPGCDWGGERNVSISNRPAPDGTRFSRICRDVTRQMDRLKRTKQGVLRRISAQGGPMYFDLRVGQFTEVPTTVDVQRKRAEYGMSFEALPGGRGPEQLAAETEEVTLPRLSLEVPKVPGEMLALGRLVVTDKQGVNQQLVLTGVEQTYYNGAATAETFYQAEGRTLVNGATSEVLAGASGGNAVKTPVMLPDFQTIISTQATGAGAHLSHVGSYRLLARVWRPVAGVKGALTIRLTWSEGDFVSLITGSENEVTIGEGEGVGAWTLIDLGPINPQLAPSGTAQRWEGRIQGKSTALETFYIDCLFLQPVTDGAAWMESNPNPVVTGTFAGYDAFKQSEGVLAGKAAESGGNWAGAGSANDFVTVGTGEYFPAVKRTAVSDVANTGRFALLGASEPTGLINAAWAIGELGIESSKAWMAAIVLRYIDANNWVKFAWKGQLIKKAWQPAIIKKVAGVETVLARGLGYGSAEGGFFGPRNGSMEASINNDGGWVLISVVGNVPYVLSGTDADLAQTGALKKGKFGIYDERTDSVAETRYYGKFSVQTPVVDAAIYANRSLELRNDRSRRESADGATWGNIPNVGDYLTIPPSGPEKRNARIFVKASRNPQSDSGIDDLAAKLYVTPRYLHAAPY